MTLLKRTVPFALVVLIAPLTAWGQERNNAWGGRAFVTFNVGAQTLSPNLTYDFTTTLFNQTATAGLKTPGSTDLFFDVGGGYRIAKNFGAGVTYSRYSTLRNGIITTTIPDPGYGYYAGAAPSTVSQEFPLQRTENAIHIAAIYRIQAGNHVQIGVFGGPSYFRCTDEHITKFALDSTYNPNWAVDFYQTWQALDRGSAWGYHAGASLTYMTSKYVGVGMTVRYSDASHTSNNHLSDTTNLYYQGVWGGEKGTGTFTMKHGGLQWSGGLSVHF